MKDGKHIICGFECEVEDGYITHLWTDIKMVNFYVFDKKSKCYNNKMPVSVSSFRYHVKKGDCKIC